MESSVQQSRKGGTRVRQLSPEEHRVLAEQQNRQWVEEREAKLAFREDEWPTGALTSFLRGVLNGEACSFVKMCYTGTVRDLTKRSNPLVEHGVDQLVSIRTLEPVIAFAGEAFVRDAVDDCVKALRRSTDAELRRRLLS